MEVVGLVGQLFQWHTACGRYVWWDVELVQWHESSWGAYQMAKACGAGCVMWGADVYVCVQGGVSESPEGGRGAGNFL